MSNTITVRRANVILDIPEYQKNEYLAKGFDVIDSQGRVIEYTTPSDINTLKTCYIQHVKEIAELKRQIAELKNSRTKQSAAVKKPVNEKPVKKPTKKQSE